MSESLNKQPPAAIRQRLQALRSAMKRSKATALLITNPVDQYYLTGFDGEDGSVIITPRDVLILTDRRFTEALSQQAPWARAHLRTNGLISAMGEAFKKLRLKRVSFQADHLSVDLYEALKKGSPNLKFESAPSWVGDLRVYKDATEIRKIRESIKVAEDAFVSLRAQIKIGMTEKEIAARLEYEMSRRGASGPSFPTIVAEGANASLPHAQPGMRKVKRNSAILIDWGAKLGHYCSDLTRVLFVGKIPPRFKDLYEIVLEAQQRAIAAVAPGKRMCDVDQVARGYIAEAGYGGEFGHGLGHGMGLDIHELPRLRFGVTDQLQVGMVVTVEPGIYLPGFGGIRIEDDVLVTRNGCEILTHLGKSLADAKMS